MGIAPVRTPLLSLLLLGLLTTSPNAHALEAVAQTPAWQKKATPQQDVKQLKSLDEVSKKLITSTTIVTNQTNEITTCGNSGELYNGSTCTAIACPCNTPSLTIPSCASGQFLTSPDGLTLACTPTIPLP